MRKVIFYIDDIAYLKKDFKKQNPNLTETEIENLLAALEPFKATYILYGKGNYIDRYELFDENGKKMNINDLNNYQTGVIISDCHRCFENGLPDKKRRITDWMH